MLKKIIVLLVANLLLIVSMASAEKYTEEEHGFLINIPNGWQIEKVAHNFMISNKVKDAKVGVSFLPGISKGYSLDDNLLNLISISNIFTKGTHSTIIESMKPVEIANQIGFQTILSIPRKDGVQTKAVVIDFFYNDKICLIIYSARQECYDELLANFKEMLSSLKFNNMTAYEWYNKGKSYQKRGMNDKAVEAFVNAMKLETMNTEYINQLAYSYSEIGKYENAIVEISKAIKLKPSAATYYSERAYAYVQNKNGQAALEDFNKAIQLNPKYAHYYAGRGNAYALMSKYTEAIGDFNKQIEMEGKSASACFNLGQCYEFAGDKEEALNYYKIVLGYPEVSGTVKDKAIARVNNDWETFKEWI